MLNDARNRLISANHELRAFLKRVEGLVQGRGDIGADDLRALGAVLRSVAADIRGTQRGVSDAELQALVREYAGSLQAAQTALEQVRCVMLSRRAKMEGERSRVSRLQGWAEAYRHTV